METVDNVSIADNKNMSTIRMEMWKKNKLRKTKKNVGNTMKRKERKALMPKTGNVTAVIPKHPRLKKKGGKQRQDKAEKRLKETERKRKYRNKVKTNSQTTPH